MEITKNLGGRSQNRLGGSGGRRQDRLGLVQTRLGSVWGLRVRLGLLQGGDAARLRGTHGAARLHAGESGTCGTGAGSVPGSGARAVPGSSARAVPGSGSFVGWRRARSRLRYGSGVGAFAARICRRVRGSDADDDGWRRGFDVEMDLGFATRSAQRWIRLRDATGFG